MRKGQKNPFGTGTNLWLAVKRDVEVKIITGVYAAGDNIPTIVELCEYYDIGKTTAQKIISALYDDGIIIKKVGYGCFVKPFVKDKLYRQHERDLKKQLKSAINSEDFEQAAKLRDQIQAYKAQNGI